MLIRVKEKEGLNKKKRKNREQREKRSRGEENARKAKVWESRLPDHKFFGGGRLWFMLFQVNS